MHPLYMHFLYYQTDSNIAMLKNYKYKTTNGFTLMWFSGFTDGSVVLTKGDITRDRHSKTLTLHEGNCPVTGLAFRQAGKVTHLFVATLEKVQV